MDDKKISKDKIFEDKIASEEILSDEHLENVAGGAQSTGTGHGYVILMQNEGFNPFNKLFEPSPNVGSGPG